MQNLKYEILLGIYQRYLNDPKTILFDSYSDLFPLGFGDLCVCGNLVDGALQTGVADDISTHRGIYSRIAHRFNKTCVIRGGEIEEILTHHFIAPVLRESV